MLENANPLIYLMSGTAMIGVAMVVPTVILEKRERDKKNVRIKRNNINKSISSNQHNVNNLSDTGMGKNLQAEKRKSYFLDLTPYEVKK